MVQRFGDSSNTALLEPVHGGGGKKTYQCTPQTGRWVETTSVWIQHDRSQVILLDSQLICSNYYVD